MRSLFKPIWKVVSIFVVGYLVIGLIYVKPQNYQLLINPKYITPVSPLYYIKTLREYFQSKFVFGEEDQADWDLDIASKRIEEAKTLRKFNQQSLVALQLNSAKSYQSMAKKLITYLSDKTNINYLKDKYNKNQEELRALTD